MRENRTPGSVQGAPGNRCPYCDENFERRYPKREAMARAFLAGNYTMQEIAAHFGVHYSTVSRAVRKLESK